MKKFLSLISMLCIGLAVSAKDVETEVNLEVIKKYPASDQSMLNLDISFAELSIKYEQVSEITIIMKVTSVPEGSECKQEIFDHFSSATRANGNNVSVKINGVFDSCKERRSCNVKVTVDITMPMKATLDGSTSFSNVQMLSGQGKVKLHSDYGNIKAEGMWAYDNELKVEFGNLDVQGSNGGRFEVEYGNVEIGNIQGSAIVDVEFGNIELKKIAPQCSHLNVKAAYGNVDVTLDAAANYAFEAHCAYGNISLDSPLKVAFSDKDYTEVTKKGTMGNGAGKLFIDVEFGNMEINVN